MRKLLVLVAVLVAGAVVYAESLGATVAVTGTSATTTLARRASSLLLIGGDGSTANTVPVYCRTFTDTDTPAAATTSSPIKLAPGEAVSLRHDPRTAPGNGILAFSCITGGTAANVRYVAD